MEFSDPTFQAGPLLPSDDGFIPYRRVGEILRVRITREPWLPWFQLHLIDGTSEELDPEETRQWFHLRGANLLAVEKALDYVWNFYGREKPIWVEIKDPIEVSMPRRNSAEPMV